MRALPSITLLLATTGLAIVAQAQTPPPGLPLKLPQPARLAPRPIAEASFRPLAMMNDMLRLNGEQSMDERAIFLTQAEAIRATAFRLSYLNAVSNLPEASRLTVRVNDQTVGEVRLDSNAAESIATFTIPPGVVVPGYNAVRLIATQRHRVDCSVRATYELWSAISLDRSGFLGLQTTPVLRRIGDLPALAASGVERTPIRVRLPATAGTTELDAAMRAVNAVVLAAGIQRPIIDVAEERGEGPGIDLVLDGGRLPGSAPLEGEPGLSYAHDAVTGRTTLTFPSGAERERTLHRLIDSASTASRTGSEPGRRALANTMGRPVHDGTQLSFGELGFESKAFDGNFFQSSMRLTMPSDFFAAPYGAARLDLESIFVGAATASRRVNIRINDQIAAVVPVKQGGSSQLEQSRVDLPIQMFKAGANTVTVEADMSGSDRACDATAPRPSHPRLLIAGTSRLSFGSLARVTTLPSLSATLSHAYPYLGRGEPTMVAVSSASPAYLNAAMTWIGRMSAAARASMPVSFRFGGLDDPGTSGLFFGPPGEASQTLARATMAVEPSVTAQPSIREAETSDAAAAAEMIVAAPDESRTPSLTERWRASAVGRLAASLSRGDLGPVASWLDDFGLIERDMRKRAGDPSPLLANDGLTILQEIGAMPPQSWRGVFEKRPSPDIKTMILASDPEALDALIAKATAAHAWSRFNGEAALLRLDSWAPENRAAQERHYLPTAYPSPANLRLSVAGWLSLNQSYYLGGLIMLSMLLAVTTALVLKGAADVMAANPSLAGAALAAALAAGSGAAAAQPLRPEATAVNRTASRPQGPQGALLLATNWPAYRAAFVTADGRVVDNGNGNISHSEGQGYALVLAVATQDRETFDRIWRWTARELYIRGDGLAAWRWEPGSTPNVTDRNNASDGDLLIAWALGEAGLRWDVPEYTLAMKRIAAAIFKHNVIKTRVGPVLLPGAVGFDAKSQPDGPVVNLSYWVFPAIDRLEVMAAEHDWAGLRRSGLTLLSEGRFGPLRVPPEWLALGAERSAPAAQFERRFSYNAIRIPLYLAWSNRVPPEHLRPFVAMWNPTENVGPFILDIDDGKASGNFDGPGYRLIFALTQCVAAGRPVPASLATAANELYYPATLALLSTLAISERRPKCL